MLTFVGILTKNPGAPSRRAAPAIPAQRSCCQKLQTSCHEHKKPLNTQADSKGLRPKCLDFGAKVADAQPTIKNKTEAQTKAAKCATPLADSWSLPRLEILRISSLSALILILSGPWPWQGRKSAAFFFGRFGVLFKSCQLAADGID